MTKNKVQNTIMKYDLIGHNDLVIVALSGGYDSMCLLHILYKLGYQVEAVHFNHGIRSSADADMDYVRQVAKNLNIKLHEEKQNVILYASENKLSVETAGRILRYEFFGKLAKKYHAKIATAHNKNDNAESFIMHLLRGAGSSGLTGIRPYIMFNEMPVIRPLIEVSRPEVEAYCKEHELNPVTDETNECCDYWRNEIRHKVMPPLIERGVLDSIERTCDIISFENDFFEEYIRDLYDKNVVKADSDSVFDVKWFNCQHIAVRRRIIKMAVETDWKHPITLLHIDAVIRACEKNYGGKVIQLPGKINAKIKQGRLLLGGNHVKCD